MELLDGRSLLGVSRDGVLFMANWDEGTALENVALRWKKQGWRMYVSAIRRWSSRLLISDGFDNAIRALRASASDAGEAASHDDAEASASA